MNLSFLLTILAVTLIVAACSASGSDQGFENPGLDQEKQPAVSLEGVTAAENPPNQPPESQASTSNDQWPEGATLQDDQGAVIVSVTPLNLNKFEGSLEFEVSLDTHSIDLSMNLADLVTLITDTGFEIQATGWDGSPGGHHVRGILRFPAELDGIYLLDEASRINLVVANLDASERIFIWER
ncbi:MAG: hypothetical protein IBX69_09755 [Anaerolineales bacterium]|nr:hypothetical protein [Anaerolineales bacterium]